MALHTVIVRDDDISYFTDIDRFAQVHRFLLQCQLPFNVAAIPVVSDRFEAVASRAQGMRPNQPQAKAAYYEISDAKQLIAFLAAHPQIDVAQHGYQHLLADDGTPEFAGTQTEDILQRIRDGKAILKKAFGREPRFFVPPFDTVSPRSLAIIRKHYDGISLSRYPHSLLPAQLWPKFAVNKWKKRHLLHWQKFIILSHPGSDLSFLPPHESWKIDHLPATDVLVIVVHSWMFFDGNGNLRDKMLQKYEKLLSALVAKPNIRFKRFSELMGD